jgi:hypothetical protein
VAREAIAACCNDQLTRKYREAEAMWRVLFIAFLLVNAAIHLAIWATPAPTDPNAPFEAGHSWQLGDQRTLAAVLALVAAVLLAAAGLGLWAHAGWWRPVAAVALGVSFGLMVLYFHPWFGFIQVVNAGLAVAIVWLHWPSAAMVGAQRPTRRWS